MPDEPALEAPPEPVSDDPILLTDFLQLLSVKGKVGQLRVANIILPTVSLGDVATPDINVRSPAYRTTDIFSTGLQTFQGAGTVLADTGALPAGTYDVAVGMAGRTTADQQRIDLEIRDAANAANLATWTHLIESAVSEDTKHWDLMHFALEIGANERLRAVQVVAEAAGGSLTAHIFARIRE